MKFGMNILQMSMLIVRDHNFIEKKLNSASKSINLIFHFFPYMNQPSLWTFNYIKTTNNEKINLRIDIFCSA